MQGYLWKSFMAMVLVTGLILCGAGPALASQHKQGEKNAASAGEVKKEAADTYEALKKYTVEQKDEAVAAAKKQIKQLDARLEAMEDNLEENWQEMSQAARQRTRAVMKDLREQRQEVAEWYGGIQHSSADAWENVKKGFARTYDRLEQSVMNAKEEFTDSSEKPAKDGQKKEKGS